MGQQATAARLLVADDDRLILATLCEGLRGHGYQVVGVDSPEAAIEACAEEDFNLALLDVRMPGMSGLEVARTIRRNRAIPAVFLSAYNDRDIVETAVREGALGYLVKPLDINQVVPTLEAALWRSQELCALEAAKGNLCTALESNRAISTAVGVLMERLRLNRQAAFETLRTHARSRRRRVHDVAEELLCAAETLNLEGEPRQDRPSTAVHRR